MLNSSAAILNRLCVTALIAINSMALSQTGHALTMNYGIAAYAEYHGSQFSYCYSGTYATSCTIGYRDAPNGELFFQFSPLLFQPLAQSFLGDTISAQVAAVAIDGHVKVTSGAIAKFSVLSGGDLLKAYAEQDGKITARDELKNEDGSISVFQASADSFAKILIQLSENLLFDIPEKYDGLAVDATITIPILAVGHGATSAFFRIEASTTSYNYKDLEIGRNYYSTDPYFFDSSIELPIRLRSAGDTNRLIEVPFSFIANFSTSPFAFGYGTGVIDSSNSVGLRVTSADGVIIRSASGDLDALLTNSTPQAIPEPQSFPLLAVGMIIFALFIRRRKQRKQHEASPSILRLLIRQFYTPSHAA